VSKKPQLLDNSAQRTEEEIRTHTIGELKSTGCSRGRTRTSTCTFFHPAVGKRPHADVPDWLRSNAAGRDLYACTKVALSQKKWTYVQNCADAKTAVIEEIIARVG
jgi:hypothetical protein